jgi:hypothetical protein
LNAIRLLSLRRLGNAICMWQHGRHNTADTKQPGGQSISQSVIK